ncbi:uncharacterized protein HKW66_Vig0154230 [Vigna angularis]|uniref:Uncharacterized protein n=1 Tax=Phaseolus angularis TaxID=3914 RepID=A0A8T0JNC9_PHAAN|nr:uncharacterized protein HKW66_Vig0154230 [Vigna angularis]
MNASSHDSRAPPSSSEVGPTSVPNDTHGTDPRAFQSNHWVTSSSVTLNRRFGRTLWSKRAEAAVPSPAAEETRIPRRGSVVPFLEAEETRFLLRNAVMHRSAAEDEDVEVVVKGPNASLSCFRATREVNGSRRVQYLKVGFSRERVHVRGYS